MRECHLKQGIEQIWQKVSRQIDQIVAQLDRDRFTPILFDAKNRSGILSLQCSENIDVDDLGRKLMARGIITSPRAGYLRLAPHYYLSDAEVLQAVDILNNSVG